MPGPSESGVRGEIRGEVAPELIVVDDVDTLERRAANVPTRAQERAKRKTSHRIPAIEDIDVVACLDRDADGNIIVRHGYDGYSTTKTQPWIKKRQGRKKAKQAKASRRANR